MPSFGHRALRLYSQVLLDVPGPLPRRGTGPTLRHDMARFLAFFLWLAPFAAYAQAPGEQGGDTGPPAELPGEVATLGAWGLIVLGLLFWLVALLPYRAPGEAGEGQGFPLLRVLQKRMEKETTGWRRLQWPILGLAFIALGVATLLEWR